MSLRHALLALAALVGPLAVACSDTPRGDQGIDFVIEAGTGFDAAPLRDATPDARGPCVEDADPSGLCSGTATPTGTPYPHLIACTGVQSPALLTCIPTGVAPAGGVATYCCTTGIL